MVRSLVFPAVALLLAIAVACGGAAEEPETTPQQPSASGASAGAQGTESTSQADTPSMAAPQVCASATTPSGTPPPGSWHQTKAASTT